MPFNYDIPENDPRGQSSDPVERAAYEEEMRRTRQDVQETANGDRLPPPRPSSIQQAVPPPPAPNTGPGSYSDIIGQLNPYDTSGMEQYMRDRLASLGGRQAPQVTATQLGPGREMAESDFRGNQRTLADYLQGIVTGNGLSPSQIGINRDRAAAEASQRSLATGAGSALAARGAAQNIAGMSGDFASRSAQAGLADKMAAAGALGGVLQGARGQDIQREGFNANVTNSTNLANAGFANQAEMQNAVMKLQQMGLDDNAINAILSQQLGVAGMANGFTLGRGTIASNLSLGQSGQQTQRDIADQNNATSLALGRMQDELVRSGRPSTLESVLGGVSSLGPLALQVYQAFNQRNGGGGGGIMGNAFGDGGGGGGIDWGGGLGGAASGASWGSSFGPWGAVAGGIIGGLGGLFF